jgi:hypothetical protein
METCKAGVVVVVVYGTAALSLVISAYEIEFRAEHTHAILIHGSGEEHAKKKRCCFQELCMCTKHDDASRYGTFSAYSPKHKPIFFTEGYAESSVSVVQV